MRLSLLDKMRLQRRKPIYHWVRTVCLVLAISWVAYSWTVVDHENKKECEYVYMLYQVVLNRQPDTAGLKLHCNALLTGAATKKQLLETFLDSPEYKLQK